MKLDGTLSGQNMPMLLFQTQTSLNSDCLGGLAEKTGSFEKPEHNELLKVELTCRTDSLKQRLAVAERCATFLIHFLLTSLSGL